MEGSSDPPSLVGGKPRQAVEPRKLFSTKVHTKSKKFAEEAVLAALADDGNTPAPSSSVAAEPATTPPEFREIPLDSGREASGFCTNNVNTAKYSILSFWPKFLYETFTRAAYVYFGVVSILCWFPAVSPFGGLSQTMAMAFVVGVGAIKAMAEDFKRHQEDKAANRSKCNVVTPTGEVTKSRWSDLKVGNMVVINDDEIIPADLLVLYTGLPDQLCFVNTANLDGESNLKICKPMDLQDVQIQGPHDAVRLQGVITVEPPGTNLYKINGKLAYTTDKHETVVAPITISEVLLRGTTLKNSKYIVGVVMYTGEETRIQMNSTNTPLKYGCMDYFLNVQIGLVVVLQVALGVVCAVAGYIWLANEGVRRYYLAVDDYSTGEAVLSTFRSFITFWLLYSYLVPISLFVTIEIVKFLQGTLFFPGDPEMVDPKSGAHAKCRNSNVNEDLGTVTYVFSDKTGTLTSNEMQLRMTIIKATAFGSVDWRIEDHSHMVGRSCVEAFDAKLADAIRVAQGKPEWMKALQSGGSTQDVMRAGQVGDASLLHLGLHMLDYWLNLCLCQSLIVEEMKDPLKPPAYQGPSPDEVALLEAARQMGFEFVGRQSDKLFLNVFGQRVVYQILNVIEYSSARARMTVIAKAPDGTIRLYCKGADARVLPRMSKELPQALMDQVEASLHMCATKGLRTLALGTKILPPREYAEWDDRYQQAATDVNNRDDRIAYLAEEIEQSMELVGATAIEDKLQDGVPEAIETLLDADIKVWMITGDKQETAINIAVSCKLIRDPESLHICNGDSSDAIEIRLHEIMGSIKSAQESAHKIGEEARLELVIDGNTLTHVLGTDLEPLLADIGGICNSVVICRASPSQKAAIVKMMMEYEMRVASSHWFPIIRPLLRYKKRLESKMLAIGDGANDVSMLQVADIGVGIMGKEGRQAVNNSDYAIGQFRFLVRLLLLHGNNSYLRITKLIAFSFYKNALISFTQFFYQFTCGFSGVSVLDTMTATLYNVVFTALPIIATSMLDRPTRYLNSLLRYPMLYRNPQNRLSTRIFWVYGIFSAVFDSAVLVLIVAVAYLKSGMNDLYTLRKAVFVNMMAVVTVEMYFLNRFMNVIFHVFTIGSFLVSVAFMLLVPLVLDMSPVPDPSWLGTVSVTVATPHFWFMIIACSLTVVWKRYFLLAFFWLQFPSDNQVVCEIERMEDAGDTSEVDAGTVARVTRLLSTTSRKGYSQLDDTGLLHDAALHDITEEPPPMKSAYMTFDDDDDYDESTYEKMPLRK